VLLLAVAPSFALEFKDGDHVVLIGSTLIEREQRYGYWEAAITARNPDKKITFRNLGWSGDTVWGEARAGFGTVADGYKHLVDHVRAEKPSVIIVGYGTNESFAGPAGLPKFKAQLTKLLDDLATTKARLVLMSPMKMIKMPGLPDPAKANVNLKLYGEAIKEEAQQRTESFIDTAFHRFGRDYQGVQDGLHLTELGYAHTTHLFEGRKPSLPLVTIRFDAAMGTCTVFGGESVRDGNTMRFRITANALPGPEPKGSVPYGAGLIVNGIRVDQYKLLIDGKPADFIDRKYGNTEVRNVRHDPESAQADKLLQTIVTKNELYFHRWRPQNITYLFGFRKHEQGNNAREIPQFDPLVAAKEKEIDELKKPREHVYELVPVKERK